MQEEIDFIFSLFEEVHLLALDDGFINCMRRDDINLLNEEYLDKLNLDPGLEKSYYRLEEILRKHRCKDSEGVLWGELKERDILPSSIQALCFLLMSRESDVFDHGLLIYCILLGMIPCSQIWSRTLFSPVLSALVSGQRILLNGVGNEKDNGIETTKVILSDLGIALGGRVMHAMDQDVIVAMGEIATKLMTGFRLDLERENQAVCDLAMNIVGKLMDLKIDYVLPHLVPVLLLEFASATTSFTARLERMRDKFCDFVIEHMKDEDKTINLCKHLIVRAPERAHLRQSAAYVICRFMESFHIGDQLIDFVLKYSRNAKATSRAFAIQLLQMCLWRITDLVKDSNRYSEFSIEIANTFHKMICNVSPMVRAASLDAISQCISAVQSSEIGPIVSRVLNVHGSLLDALKKRIIDEKWIVRRAALSCLCSIMQTMPSLSPDILELIAGRVRDRAVRVRQDAIRVLNRALEGFPSDVDLRKTWLDSVLPLVVDNENTVQNEAFEAVRTVVLAPIEANAEDAHIFTEHMTADHFEFFRNVLQLFKQKAIDLGKLARALTTRCLNDKNDIPAWKLIEILSSVHKDHFAKNAKKFQDLWDQRDEFPPEYLSVLCNIGGADEKMQSDCVEQFSEMLHSNKREYHRLHGILSLVTNEEIRQNLLSRCCRIVNDVAQNQNSSSMELYSLLSTLYSLGELIIMIENKKSLGNFDFSGIEVLMLDELPNQTTMPSSVKAMAIIAVGKLCLQDRVTASNLIDVIGMQLVTSNDPTVKCNCLVTLCDLCVQYTAMVDAHTRIMTNCFADPSVNVRRQALQIVTKLVVEDYLKMTDVLFFKYVYIITDDDPDIACFAQRCLFDVILTKHTDIITSNFIACFSHINDDKI